MSLGVILAGGKATRLGPLAAQLNKSLVTVGGKPMLVRQVQQLRMRHVKQITVITSPGSADQVLGVIQRAGLKDVKVRVQREANGPGGALACCTPGTSEPVIVLHADTLLADSDVPLLVKSDELLAGVQVVQPHERAWCYRERADKPWREGVPDRPVLAAVGAWSFGSALALKEAANWAVARKRAGSETGMADVVNAYLWSQQPRDDVYVTESWQDVGDVPALQRATRGHFISREFNSVLVTNDGTVVKQGPGMAEQGTFMRRATNPQLWPRVLNVDVAMNSYEMEFIDMPSLAELFLYWPGNGDMWSHITTELVKQLRDGVWGAYKQVESDDLAEMYGDKLLRRYSVIGSKPSPFRTEDSGKLMWLAEWLATSQEFEPLHVTSIHGDPNFTNVLWSLRSGTFKLLDPRPRWGHPLTGRDALYDVGKIAYSPDFAAITHDLFDVGVQDGEWFVDIWPTGPASAVDDALSWELGLSSETIQLLKAYMLLSSAPLHEPRQAAGLYVRGMEVLDAVRK